MQYRKEDVYQDVRRLVEEGHTCKETSQLTGVNPEYVRRWTLDIRDVVPHAKWKGKYDWNKIEKDRDAGLSLTDLIQKYGISRDALQSHFRKKRKEEEEKMAGTISKTLDPRQLAAEAMEKKAPAPKTTGDGLKMGYLTIHGTCGVHYLIDTNSQRVAFNVTNPDGSKSSITMGIGEMLAFAQECVKVASKADRVLKILEEV